MFELESFITRCEAACEGPDAQAAVEALMREAVQEPEAMRDALAGYRGLTRLEDLAVHRSDTLTLLAAAVPPGFVAAPHNHNIWAVIGVYGGREDNQFFRRADSGLEATEQTVVPAPGVLTLPKDVIHSIANTQETELLALHAYGGDLLSTPRSTWDPKTHEEIPFDWEKVARS